MANLVEDMIDRRMLRRKLSFWRIVALAVAAIAIIAVAAFGIDKFGAASGNHIARIPVDGTILNDRELVERIKDA
ncbi:MAG: signal peptide peptidase SppA, partial [Notoacmeibacter sp.]